MKIERIYTNINTLAFRQNSEPNTVKSENAILMLRDPNAAIKFQKNQEYAKKADSVDSNPFVALGYKLYRTFSMIKGTNTESLTAENKQFSTVA